MPVTIVSKLCVDVYGLVSDVCIYSGDCVLSWQVLYMDGCQCLCGYAVGFQTTLWFVVFIRLFRFYSIGFYADDIGVEVVFQITPSGSGCLRSGGVTKGPSIRSLYVGIFKLMIY